jgi:YVTN family beta-propeller protein
MTQTLPNGSLLNSRFRVRRLLSESSLGAVYLVDDIRVTEKTWAAREYLPLPAAPNEKLKAEEKFSKTVEIIKGFQHPQLIRVLDSFSEANRSYLVMEFVDGLTMEAIAKLAKTLSEKQVLEWALQMCEPLKYLHELPTPFYIKDLSPQYFIVNRDGKILVGGYGLDLIFSKFYNVSSAFTAPELKENEEGSISGDIYTFGACLYYILTKKKPSLPIQPIRKDNPQISASLCQLIETCLQQDPVKRYSSVSEIQDELSKILYPPAPEAPPKPSVKTRVRLYFSSRISRAKVKILPKLYYAVLLAAVLGGIYFAFHSSSKFGPFVKTGPIAYILGAKNTYVVDLNKFKLSDEIPKVGGNGTAQDIFKKKGVLISSSGGSLVFINPENDKLLFQYFLGEAIGGVAVKKDKKTEMLFVSLPQRNLLESLSVRRTVSQKKIEVFPEVLVPVGKDPEDVVYNPKNDELYIANVGSDSITVVNAKKYLVKAVLSLSSTPNHIALSPDGKWLFVVDNHARTLNSYSTSDFSLGNSISFDFRGPYTLISLKKEVLVAAYGGDRVEIYGASSLSKKGVISVDHPESMAFVSSDNEILVGSQTGSLFLFNLGSGNLVSRINKIGKNLSYILPLP